MSIKVQLETPSTSKNSIMMLPTGAWEVRNDCSARREWKLDKNTGLKTNTLEMVILGYTTLFGFVPYVGGFEDLEQRFKMMGVNPSGFSPEDYYQQAYERLAKYWGYVLFVPVNPPEGLPQRTVCGTLIKSTGLNKGSTGLLGNKGLLDKLATSNKRPQDVVSIASIEVTHVSGATGGDVNGVVWSYREPKNKEEQTLIADVATFLQANSQNLGTLMPHSTLRHCQEVDLLHASANERLQVQARVMSSAFSFCPDLAVLAPSHTVDVHVDVLDEAEDTTAITVA